MNLISLKLKEVHFHIGQATILKSVNLEVPIGKFITIIGPNGSGKSHLMKCMAGLIHFAGTVELGEENLMYLSHAERARRRSWLGQNPEYEFNYSLRDCVLMGRFSHHNGLPGKEDRSRAEQELVYWGIAHLADRGMNQLSQGERQRAFLARTFAADTKLILLDEPDHNLDVKAKLLLFKKIKSICLEGATVIAVLHSLYDVMEHSDWAVLLKNGEVMDAGEAQLVLNERNLSKLLDVSVSIGPDHQGQPSWLRFSDPF